MTDFRRSSFCEAGTCVEVAWRISTRSGANGACVEAGPCSCGDSIRVRDSKDREGPVLTFTHAEWDAFVAGAKLGEFDL